ncbi:PH domain-containing protein [Kribbella monticola]|uniref:PH domain-containing protein n=1 Tax=Kribbella monticola TaxID=2185285 RepID=UPI0013008ADB|nr:PH domain-containing protein [Kribbella monticola]
METQELQWGTKTPVKVLACLPLVGALGWLVVAGGWQELWPMLLLLAAMAYLWSRGGGARLTEDELVLRYPIGTRRIPRSQVVDARFTYNGMRIRLRDGSRVHAFLQPKWSSTELSSGGVPGPDSAAYKITEWAKAA